MFISLVVRQKVSYGSLSSTFYNE